MDIAWLKRYGFIVIFIILAMAFFFASGIAKASNNHHKPVCNGGRCNNVTTSQNLSADVVIDQSFIAQYDPAVASAYADVASGCHKAFGTQTENLGVTFTMIDQSCAMLRTSEALLKAAAVTQCTAPDYAGKGGTIHNACTGMRESMMRDGLQGIRDAHKVASRKPGIAKRGWQFIW